MTTLLLLVALTATACPAFAQTTEPTSDLATPTGHDVSAGVSGYTYREPGDLAISIHGLKFVGEYTGALALSKQRRWFLQGNVRGVAGSATYDGWCSPYIITPNSSSPNGYQLDLGDASTCSESGDQDWYVEARAFAGKDLIRSRWGWSPYSGIGLRYLSNGTTGVHGFRTDRYLYLPLGLTARTAVASRRAVSLTVEVDALLHGWQHTDNSKLGGGDVPATPTAPAFTIVGFSDVSFSQSKGWALRASGKYPVTRRWSLEPYYVRWDVGSSPVDLETATFTVNNITASEQLGFFEPHNVTHELGIRLGFHF